MKVLVTGATSGLGRNAVEYLRNRGISVRATGRNEAMGKLLSKMGAEFVPADLTELVSSQAKVMLAGIDTLWHCSSFTSPWGTQQAFDLANVRATRRLGEWAVAWGVRNFVHISSPSLYFDYHHHRDVAEDFRPQRFANEFARSKAASEDVINLLAQANPNTRFTILRPQSLFGPHDKVFIPRLAQMMQHYGSVLLPRGGSALVDMTFYENAVHAMWLASRRVTFCPRPARTTLLTANRKPCTALCRNSSTSWGLSAASVRFPIPCWISSPAAWSALAISQRKSPHLPTTASLS